MLKSNYPGNIQKLVFRGFLDLRLDVPGGQIRLKSLNENEYADIEFYSGFSYDELQEIENVKERSIYFFRFLPWLLTWSTLLVDDMNVLVERKSSGWFRPLVEFYQQSNPRFLLSLESSLLALRSWYVYESSNAIRLAMDPTSRLAWPSYTHSQLNDPSITCFSGTELLGLNIHQVTFKGELFKWSHKLEQENQWEVAKFLGSFQDPKFIKKVEGKDKNRRQQEEELEGRILGGEIDPTSTKEQIYQEMEEEALKQMREKRKDAHDLQVESHDRGVKIHAFRVGFLPFLYSIMYSRKLRRKDAVVLGRERKETPSDKLPLGEYDVKEARNKAFDFMKELDHSGMMASRIQWTENELDGVLADMAQEAHRIYEKRKDKQDESQRDH